MRFDTALAERNTSISILRLFMSFVVILTHFGTTAPTVFTPFGEAAVPSFIFISFYLTADSLGAMNGEKLKKRFWRLIFPLLFWSLAYYVLFSAAARTLVDYRQLLISVLFGSARALNPTLWYLGALVFTTGILFICCFVFPTGRAQTLFLTFLLFLCLALQYTGINAYLFNVPVYETGFLFGRLAEAIPFAVAGVLFRRYEKALDLPKLLALIAALGLGALLLRALPEAQGFGYQGLGLFFWASFICVSLISLPHIKNSRLAWTVNYLAQYTLGIYCLHYGVGTVLQSAGLRLGFSFWNGSLLFDLSIWLICLAASICVDLLSKKLRWLRYAVM